jgi:hypothetical protein
MATWQHELVDPPGDSRSRELWLQHAAGFILLEDVRRYAMERVDAALTDEARAAVQKGIDDALYGVMMVIDGVTGAVSNSSSTVSIDFIVRLVRRDAAENGGAVAELDLRQGDGMCMGYHGWLEGDFGTDPVAVPRLDNRS